MTVPSPAFLVFALIAAVVFNLSRAVRWRQAVLLLTNAAFLASFSHDPVVFVPLIGLVAFGYLAQHFTRDGHATRLFPALIVLTLVLFFWLKRYSFLPSATFLPFPYLLLGLSYVFFRVLHVLIDRHQGAIEQRIGLVSYLNYTLNFTSITSGPIQRYQDYKRMEDTCLPLDLIEAGNALERIIIGYFKVAIVSMALSMVQHQAIAALSAQQTLPDRIWSGFLIAAIYPLYLYLNFSGYVDVVIGVARFFRIELPENFDRPFSSENFIVFWSRWHITLSNWLKTYVYNPLMIAGMTRLPAPKLAPYISVVAFFVTFFLVGIWHGRTSEFIFFGFLQGGGVAANKLYQVLMQERLGRKGYLALAKNPVYRACSRGLTFTWFAFTLFWFWSSWTEISNFAQTLGPVVLIVVWVIVFATATILLAAGEALHAGVLRITWNELPVVRSRYLRTAWDTSVVVVTVAILLLLNSPTPGIVYKTF